MHLRLRQYAAPALLYALVVVILLLVFWSTLFSSTPISSVYQAPTALTQDHQAKLRWSRETNGILTLIGHFYKSQLPASLRSDSRPISSQNRRPIRPEYAASEQERRMARQRRAFSHIEGMNRMTAPKYKAGFAEARWFCMPERSLLNSSQKKSAAPTTLMPCRFNDFEYLFMGATYSHVQRSSMWKFERPVLPYGGPGLSLLSAVSIRALKLPSEAPKIWTDPMMATGRIWKRILAPLLYWLISTLGKKGRE